MDFTSALPMEPGTFYETGAGFFLPTKSLLMRTAVTVGQKLSVESMFSIYLASSNGERVGFFFTTRFEIVNGGGYLLTHLQNKKPATEVNVIVKTDDLVVYDYPNRGTLAISPLVSSDIITIFEEQ
jgi:hypothetical protein